MATRQLAEVPINAGECTGFQFHKNTLGSSVEDRRRIFDFTEHRLLRLIARSRNVERQSFLKELVERYRNGDATVAWRYGEPVWIDVTRGA